MGLLNIYDSISKLRPHITYRFSATIAPHKNNTETNSSSAINFTIKNLTFPTFSITNDTKRLFGNTQISFPTIKFGEREMSITFEESDDMLVFNTLSNIYNNGLPFMNESLALTDITITQFNETMTKMIDRKIYVCRIKDFSFPTFNNNDLGSPIELKANFYVLYSVDNVEELSSIKTNENGSTQHKKTNDGIDTIFNKYLTEVNAEEAAIDATRNTLPIGSSKPLPKGRNTELIQGMRGMLLNSVYDKIDPSKREQFVADIDKYSQDKKISKAEKEELKKNYNLTEDWVDSMQGSLGAERLFSVNNYKDNLKMTVEEYENTKQFLNDTIKLQIEAEIKNGNKDWEKHTRLYKNEAGEEVEATYYTYAGKASFLKDGKEINRSFNREKDNKFKDKKVEDITFHTTGNFYADLNTVLSNMAQGGQSATMFEDFAIVKKETISKGRVYSALGSEDYADEDTKRNSLGIEYVSASGVSDKQGLHTTHSTGKKGFIEITDESGKKFDSQADALNVADDKIRTKGSKNALYHSDSQDIILKAITDDMNENKVGAFNFNNVNADSVEYNKNNIHKDQRGKTQLISHDNVSNKQKEGESSVDVMNATVNNINSWTSIKK